MHSGSKPEELFFLQSTDQIAVTEIHSMQYFCSHIHSCKFVDALKQTT